MNGENGKKIEEAEMEEGLSDNKIKKETGDAHPK